MIDFTIVVWTVPSMRDVTPSLKKFISKFDDVISFGIKFEDHIKNVGWMDKKPYLFKQVKKWIDEGQYDYILHFTDDAVIGKNLYKAMNHIIESKLLPNKRLCMSLYSPRKEVYSKPFGIKKTRKVYDFGLLMNKNFLRYLYSTKDYFLNWRKRILNGEKLPQYDKYAVTSLGSHLERICKIDDVKIFVTNPTFVQHGAPGESLLGNHAFGESGRLARMAKNFDINRDLYETVKNWKPVKI